MLGAAIELRSLELRKMQLDVPAFAKAVESLQLGSTVSLDHRGVIASLLSEPLQLFAQNTTNPSF